MHKVTFFGFDCIVVKGTYRANQQVALSLIADDTSNNLDQGVSTGEPIATATLCLKGERFSADETVIKDYSENEGLLDQLLGAGIVQNTGRFVATGFVQAPVVKVCI